ncbi:putative membrane protein [Propionispora sp. 2/2-37]|uniref:PTS mannose/fructose/sorbose/N-acetylgalactosamine transporter subunit IIC n=1 Tax=Propionispora sp. 2/2-37 TaxID=1677858 RepID=UPI0006BB82FF|nr:PTS sugar transporter subunit IIC [Propionispora sp. 2/2-37]CUH97783.1 putative membrane protein [Propionispora sp. 2/2-37]
MIVEAALVGLLYYIATNRIWYGFSMLIRQPLSLSVFIGLIFGDMQTALLTGATLQMMYLGAIAPGGNIPTDEALATCVALPIAIQAHVSPEVAVTIAVPVGLVGVLLDELRRTLCTGFVHMADKCAERADVNGIRRLAFLYPLLLVLPIRFIPVFLANIFGVDAVQAFMNAVPHWVMQGLNVAGNILPALGFALTMVVIGKKNFIPFFIMGFFIVAYSGISIVGVAIFGFCLAAIYTHFQPMSQQREG